MRRSRRHSPVSDTRARTALLVCLGVVCTLAGAVLPAAAQPDRALHLEAIESIPDRPGLAPALGDLVGLWPGQEIDAADLRAARRTIARSGWYERVEVYTRPGSEPGTLVLRVEGELDDGVRLETGFGHDPLDDWYLNLVGLRAHHLIGPASTARLNFQFGRRRTALRLELEARRVGGSGVDLLLDASGGAEQWNVFDGERFYTQEIGRGHLHIGARVHPTRSTALTLWLGGSSADPQGLTQEEGERRDPAPGLVGSFAGQERFADLRLDLTLDRRDQAQPWRRGLWTLLRATVSAPDSGTTFVRTRAAVRAAVPMPAQQALAFRGDLAWTDPGTPYHLRPIFGGQGSVRGFRDASLSGGRGARAIAAASMEWRAPLLPRGAPDARVHGVLFVDTGRFVDADGDTGRWSTSVGWGLRVRLPWVERVALDAAIPLTPTETGDPFWVHGSLGFGF